jgi:hypothetical protein
VLSLAHQQIDDVLIVDGNCGTPSIQKKNSERPTRCPAIS